MKRLLFIALLLMCGSLAAQETRYSLEADRQPLAEVLRQLETGYGIRFAYDDRLVTNDTVSVSTRQVSLEALLTALLRNTALEFEVVDPRYVVIRLKLPKALQGTVVADDSGIPETGVTIYVLNSTRGTISDSLGRFRLNGPFGPEDQVVVRHILYETDTVPLAAIPEGKWTVRLQPKLFQLKHFTVSEYLTSGIELDALERAVVLRPQRIGVLPGLTDADVLQSAQLLPGVNSPDETAAGLQIRGGTPDQNLVLWDDIPVYHSGHYFGMISAFNPHAVGKYEVFRNGFGAEHGGRVAGLVNIASDNTLKDRVEAGGGANLLFGDAYAKVPLGSSGACFMVAGRRSFTDLFNSLPYERLNERVFQHTRVVEDQQLAADQLVELLDDFQFTDLNASITLPTSKGTLSLSGLYVQNRLDHAVFEGDFGLALEDRLDLDNWGMSARWDAGSSGKQQALPLSVVAAHSEYDYKYDFFMSEIFGLLPLESSFKENLVRHSTLKATLSPSVGNDNRLKLGYQLDRQQVVFRVEYVEVGEDDLVESSDTTTYRHSLFGEYTLQLGPITVQPGLRYQYNSINQTHYLEPRGFVHWRLSDALRLRATGGLYHQFISQLLELDFNELGVNNQVWSLSNDDNVPVVSSDHWSVGAIWRKHGWLVDVEGYFKRQRDITSLTTSFSAIQDNPYSEGSATMTGIDVLLKKQWHHVRAWVSYTLSRFQYDFEEISAESFSAPHDQRHNLAAAVIVDRGPWSFSLGWRLGSGLPYTELNGLTEVLDEVEDESVWRPDWGTQNNERLRTYHRLDASVLYHLTVRKVRFDAGISVLNAYNRTNYFRREFVVEELENVDDDDQEPEVIRQDRQALRILPNLLLRARF